MGDRYFFNSDGSYRGRSSDDGPYGLLGYAVLIIFVILLLRGC